MQPKEMAFQPKPSSQPGNIVIIIPVEKVAAVQMRSQNSKTTPGSDRSGGR